jgi:hypothetical protein
VYRPLQLGWALQANRASQIRACLDARFLKHRPFLNLKLLREEQCPSLVVVADLMELDFVRDRWREPCAADNADFASS